MEILRILSYSCNINNDIRHKHRQVMELSKNNGRNVAPKSNTTMIYKRKKKNRMIY